MPNINPSIFRAYDIRGTADPLPDKAVPDLTEETARLIGRGCATHLARNYGSKNMLVGRDNRLHSEKLQKAFMDGVISCGLDVTDIGLTTSPMVYFASFQYGADSVVNVTASHNPKAENGFKIVEKNNHLIAADELQEILKLIQNNDFLNAKKNGQLNKIDTLPRDYQDKIIALARLSDARKRPLKIVLDAGNGVTGAYAPAIFRALGCQVTELFCDLDGTFPNHEANPEQSKNMVALGQKVISVGADLGIGFDGDGDRVGVVDEKGRHYSAEYPIMLIARDLLKASPGEKIIHDVKVNQALIDDIKNHGGQPVMSRVGHSFIKQRLVTEDATFGGEKSGHLFFGRRYFNFYGFDDAIFAATKIVEALSKTTESFSEIFADLPQKPGIPELKIPCPDETKSVIIDAVTRHFVQLYNCLTLDGVRVQFDDGAWILIRYSNTSPCLTIHAEAPTEKRLQEIKELAFGQLRQFPELKLP